MSCTKFLCPHCSHIYSDDMELLDAGELQEFRCESCGKPFQVLIQECTKCTAETVTVWPERPTYEAVALVACGSCGNSFKQEALEDDD
jgi:transcription elongation factor Elf1